MIDNKKNTSLCLNQEIINKMDSLFKEDGYLDSSDLPDFKQSYEEMFNLISMTSINIDEKVNNLHYYLTFDHENFNYFVVKNDQDNLSIMTYLDLEKDWINNNYNKDLENLMERYKNLENHFYKKDTLTAEQLGQKISMLELSKTHNKDMISIKIDNYYHSIILSPLFDNPIYLLMIDYFNFSGYLADKEAHDNALEYLRNELNECEANKIEKRINDYLPLLEKTRLEIKTKSHPSQNKKMKL